MENGDYCGAVVGIDINCERVKEGVGGRGRDVVLVTAGRHTTELMEEIELPGGLGAVAWWCGG